MYKNKIIVAIVFGMMLFPGLNVQAMEGSTSTDANVEVDSNKEPLLPKPKSSVERGDVGSVRSGIQGNIRPLGGSSTDDPKPKLGPRIEGNSNGDAKVRAELSTEQREKMRANAEARKEEIKAKIAERKGEIKMKLEAKAKERVKMTLATIFKRLNAQLDKLVKLDVRVGEKITALKTGGMDTTAMSSQYVIAQTALAKAKVDVEATSSISTDQANTETSKETLRSLVKTAEDSIKAAGAEYRKVIELMPNASVNAKVETKADSSATVNQ